MSDPKISLTRLSSNFDLAAFDCGDGELNDFLVDNALGYQGQFLANTTLVLSDAQVVTYFSLASDAIQLTLAERERDGIDTPFSQFPALKIARLATDARFQRRGFGTLALQFSVGLARHLNNEHRHDGVGCRFVTVDAYPQSAAWYRTRGFVNNGRASKRRETISLRYDALFAGSQA